MGEGGPEGADNLLEIKRRILLPLACRSQQIRNRRLLRHYPIAYGLRNNKEEVNIQCIQ